MNSSLPCIARGELTVVAIGVVLADAQTFLSSMPYDTRVTLCCSDLDVLHMPYRMTDPRLSCSHESDHCVAQNAERSANTYKILKVMHDDKVTVRNLFLSKSCEARTLGIIIE